MAKDPRFNFYPDNYEGGTTFFTLEQDGAYLRLLILQFKHGAFSERQAITILMQRCPETPAQAKKLWSEIKGKFETDGNLFWSVRLKSEIDKSAQYSKDQSDRASNGWDKRKAHADASAYAEPKPDERPNDASNSNSNTIINTPFKTQKTNTAKADVFAFDRKELISELNMLLGRNFDPDAEYFRRDINARIKQYGVPDLIDMIRFMVYKRKGSEWEQYLKPDTMFSAKKCGAYMDTMKHHRDNGLMPKKDVKSSGPKSRDEMMEEFRSAQAKKYATQ